MTAMDKIQELNTKKKQLELGGGQSFIDEQHSAGKKTARERIELLIDEGSFVEIGVFAEPRTVEFGMAEKKAPGDGVVAGYGTINDRPVYVAVQDYTVISGSIGKVHAGKISKAIDMALKMGVPFIGMYDSAGVRLEEGLDALEGIGRIFSASSKASGLIPQISVVCGPCGGGLSFVPSISDFVFMIDEKSSMFLNSPQVIQSIIKNEELTGTAQKNASAGITDFVSNNEIDCINDVKKLLSLLPDNSLSVAEYVEGNDDPNRLPPKLDGLLPGAYNMLNVLTSVVDDNLLMEVKKDYAKNIITGLARVNGRTVGIVANQPLENESKINIQAAKKATEFIATCDVFNIPVITFTDTTGFVLCDWEENNGISTEVAKMAFAFSEATVPKINIITGKAYGSAYVAMNSSHIGADMVYAWPVAEIAVTEPATAVTVLNNDDIAASDDPVACRNQKFAEFAEKHSSAYAAAKLGYVDDVIQPSATRVMIASALQILDGKR